MNSMERLIELDSRTPKKVACVGDSMIDRWVEGSASPCQDHCQKLHRTATIVTAGGAANAAHQLTHWQTEAKLYSPFMLGVAAFFQLNRANYTTTSMPVKTRFIDQDNRIVFRHDDESPYLDENLYVEKCLPDLKKYSPDAVLLSDYDKGFLTPALIHDIIAWCMDNYIPCVADGKRAPELYLGAVLKVNGDYAQRYGGAALSHSPAAVITYGSNEPLIFDEHGQCRIQTTLRGVPCVNHVGAGDCFAAHLTLALAHSLTLVEATQIAHSAGRVFVQHRYGRAPWPHEILKDLDPVGGKVLALDDMPALRRSEPGRIVFTNGVFRLLHAGHAWLLDWSKKQGDVLVVGVNDDASAGHIRNGEPCLPLEHRIALLAAMECVDWIVPFSEDTPVEVIAALKPDVLTKGGEYSLGRVPGDELVTDVRFAPEGPFSEHASHFVEKIRYTHTSASGEVMSKTLDTARKEQL